MYSIKPYSFEKAKKLGVTIQPSTKGNYKIDVFGSDGKIITSIGDKRYSDYPSYMITNGKEYAEKRRALYHQRHKKDTKERGLYALSILW
jgi:hypothetical protein